MILEQTSEHTVEAWQTLHLWLRLLWPEDWSGFLAVCHDEDGKLKQQWKNCSGTASLCREVAELSVRTNVWLSCCSFGAKKRNRSGAVQLPGLWVDIDTKENHRTNNGELSTEDLPTEAEALAALDRLPISPSVIVRSGGGFFVWWLFHTPQQLEDRQQFQKLLKHWEGMVRRELAGKHLDTTSDFARILRSPGLLNHKYGTAVEFFRPQLSGSSYADQLRQLRESVPRYRPEEFLRLLPKPSDEEQTVESDYCEKDREDALAALKRLKPSRADKYSEWVKVGLCLAEIEHSAEMLGEWLDWSRQSAKFREEQLDEYRQKWNSFQPEATGFAVGSLVAMANEDDPPTEVAVVGILPNPKKKTMEPEPAGEIRRFEPFPVDCLPSPFDELVENGSKALQVDPSMVAVPLLSVLAGAVGGNSFRLVVKKGWLESPIVWTVASADSGTGKTHAFDLAVDPLTEIQRRAFRRFAEEQQSFEILKTEYDRQLLLWKKDKGTGITRPDPPSKPVCWRVKVDDTTVEALVARLAENPRGLLVAVDELSGFFGSFDRYSSGGSGDESKWLRAYDGKDLTADRKTGDRPVTYVPRAGVSISGTIQPELLRKYFTAERMESGLVSRFLIVEPPEPVREGWTEAEVDQMLKDRCLEIVEALAQFQGEPVDDGSSERKPVFLGMSRSGKKAFVEWCNYHQGIQTETFGAVRAAYAKLKSVPARLGLVFHLTRRAAGDPTLEHPEKVDGSSIEAGRRVAEFFRNEIERLYSTFGETSVDREQRKLLQLIQSKGGEITPRNLSRTSRHFQPVSNAAAYLQKLVETGKGSWREDRPSGGGPTSKVFVLN